MEDGRFGLLVFENYISKFDRTIMNDERESVFGINNIVDHIENVGHLKSVAENAVEVFENMVNVPKTGKDLLGIVDDQNESGNGETEPSCTAHEEKNKKGGNADVDAAEHQVAFDCGFHEIAAGTERSALEVGVAMAFVGLFSVGLDGRDVGNRVGELAGLASLGGSFLRVEMRNAARSEAGNQSIDDNKKNENQGIEWSERPKDDQDGDSNAPTNLLVWETREPEKRSL